MSGKERRSDGLLGERGNERRRAPQAPPVLHATALLLDSTPQDIRQPTGLASSIKTSSASPRNIPPSSCGKQFGTAEATRGLTSIVAEATVWKLNSAKLMCRQGLQAWTMF
jgi:hypothetical protein